MGLDQYAYVAMREGQRDDFYQEASIGADFEIVSPNPQPREIAYWRKHPNLQGWMERLWKRKTGIPTHKEDQFINGVGPIPFNGVELELTWDDIEQLEADIRSGAVAELCTTGYFFGNPSDHHYYQQDLDFCRDARVEIFNGQRVFYNSSW